MKNLKAFALTALTALTLAAPVQARQGDMAPMENCQDIYRQAAYETECYVQNVGYRTVEQYIAQYHRPQAPVTQPNNTANGLAIFNMLANTNTTVEGPCASGTDRFGNTVCTGNNGLIQHEIRRDGFGNQELIGY